MSRSRSASIRFLLAAGAMSFFLAGCEAGGSDAPPGAGASEDGAGGASGDTSAADAAADSAPSPEPAADGSSDSNAHHDAVEPDAHTGDDTHAAPDSHHGIEGDVDGDASEPDVAPGPPLEAASQPSGYSLTLYGATPSLKMHVVHALDLDIASSAGEPAPGLFLDAKFIHTVMGHGSSKVPWIEDLGGGHYRVHDVLASMPGGWTLTVLFTGDGESHETATFEIVAEP